ncbi:hypothetical protein HNQ50_001259 [Silvimonas terrae]|uniref:Nitrogen fixation protein FixH n=1 Tax=Silvimonas terrae TaxID=300266 RepID=A0A840RC64_9NEIS|nr:FixH family protein [Silvimonas terrae]MBB5190537.1 hypothetical protein [Silvimonas terrae]
MQEKKPWYKPSWAWFVLALPLIAILGCINLIWLAGKHNDGAVADDYTRTGDEVTQVVARDQFAARLGLRAEGGIDEHGQVHFTLNQTAAGPLQLRLIHPTVAANDQQIVLKDMGAQNWQGQLAHPLGEARWEMALVDGKNQWRLRGQIKPGQKTGWLLQPRP